MMTPKDRLFLVTLERLLSTRRSSGKSDQEIFLEVLQLMQAYGVYLSNENRVTFTTSSAQRRIMSKLFEKKRTATNISQEATTSTVAV
jgi:hypothetical protein